MESSGSLLLRILLLVIFGPLTLSYPVMLVTLLPAPLLALLLVGIVLKLLGYH